MLVEVCILYVCTLCTYVCTHVLTSTSLIPCIAYVIDGSGTGGAEQRQQGTTASHGQTGAETTSFQHRNDEGEAEG